MSANAMHRSSWSPLVLGQLGRRNDGEPIAFDPQVVANVRERDAAQRVEHLLGLDATPLREALAPLRDSRLNLRIAQQSGRYCVHRQS